MVMIRLRAILIAIDQLFAAILLGYPDETLSAAAYRLGKQHKRWRVAENIIDAVFFWDRKTISGMAMRHCQLSYRSEVERKQYPSHYNQYRRKL